MLRATSIEWVTFHDAFIKEQVAVSPVGPNVYRLVETPLALGEDLELGTIVETERAPDGVLRIVRIVERSSMETFEFLLNPKVRDSRGFEDYCKKLEAAGGEWEVIASAWLLIHLPRGSGIDVKAALEAISPTGDEVPNMCVNPRSCRQRNAHPFDDLRPQRKHSICRVLRSWTRNPDGAFGIPWL